MEFEDSLEKEQEQRIPNQKELEKELSEYLSKKYGDRIKIVSPLLFPQSEPKKKEEGGKRGAKKSGVPAFDMKPEELESYLNGYVVKQDQAKGVLATKICTHFNRIKSPDKRYKKENPSSVGMIKNSSRFVCVHGCPRRPWPACLQRPGNLTLSAQFLQRSSKRTGCGSSSSATGCSSKNCWSGSFRF